MKRVEDYKNLLLFFKRILEIMKNFNPINDGNLNSLDNEKIELFNTNISNLNSKMSELSTILNKSDHLKNKIDSLREFKESMQDLKNSVDNLSSLHQIVLNLKTYLDNSKGSPP